MSARLPLEVGAQIVLPRPDVRSGNEPASFALRAVGLDAERVDDENEGAIELVEGIEVDLDVVVGADAVAVGERRGNGSAWRERAQAEVDRVRGVPDPHFGGVGRRTFVDGGVEREAGEQRRLAPDRLVESAVDRDDGFDFRDGDVGVAGAPVVNRRSYSRDELERGKEGNNHALGNGPRGRIAGRRGVGYPDRATEEPAYAMRVVGSTIYRRSRG